MLFYNTVLKTIQVSTSYNSYFGLMRQMYKKISFLQNKGIFLTKILRYQGAVFLIQFFNTYYDTFVFKREEQNQIPISNELSKETTTE